ncbi:MAG: hypothetical protein WCX31_01455 [Salinivirgaceae bacterium]|jgi:hypothetical protein
MPAVAGSFVMPFAFLPLPHGNSRVFFILPVVPLCQNKKSPPLPILGEPAGRFGLAGLSYFLRFSHTVFFNVTFQDAVQKSNHTQQ